MIFSSQGKNHKLQIAKIKHKTEESTIFLCGILNLEIRIWIQNLLELLDPDPVENEYGCATLGVRGNLLRGYSLQRYSAAHHSE
jgi:hypothetical protein